MIEDSSTGAENSDILELSREQIDYVHSLIK